MSNSKESARMVCSKNHLVTDKNTGKMKYHVDDLRILGEEELASPEALLHRYPISDKGSETVFSARNILANIMHGRDDRLAVIVGPCSIHDPESALEYAKQLGEQAKRHQDHLFVVMRMYFEKPRTTVGWKGLINDPNLDDSYAIHEGLQTARKLLLALINMKLPAGTEYLDPITPQYIGDLISWAAIGARTTESQIHRQLASGLSCPVGFKNNTEGSVQTAVDAVEAARRSHIFFGVTKSGSTAIFSTAGNEDCHVVLRGGRTGPNYDAASIQQTAEQLNKIDQPTGIVVDMSHANSNKDHLEQLAVCHNLAEQIADGNRHIAGVMLESHLVAGRQDLQAGKKLQYGQSITDACIGWEDTEKCLQQLAEAVQKRKLLSLRSTLPRGRPG